MKEAYGDPGTPAAPIASSEDFRTSGAADYYNYSVIQARPSNAEIGDYFFLPAMGYYDMAGLYSLGTFGCYWSSSAYPWGGSGAHFLAIQSVRVGINNPSRNLGVPARPFE